ncbi:transcriptional regulator with XRE-family HTH domain [Nocardia transvalensis]|uniref:Transcriptional regulator with XRE-family HTH domain n=1 Tax=Nocardia transvalensis TaxID=37333 RepID=A0A7W9PJR6_9NOCA|nr:helix-turn-helix domain-containing protein [Nocardia transvalensis]MBB5917439.1 transcriptional regulator with XRE-family HTH domain [Nocardia transvalensis]
MDTPDYMPVGRILQQWRRDAALTVDELAAEANLSESLLRKVESGHRPATRATVTSLASILRIPAADTKQLLLLVDPAHAPVAAPDAGRPPSPRELTVLDSDPFPACYMVTPAGRDLLEGALHRIVATNEAFERFFPGLAPGAGVVEYELLAARARDVFVRWEEDAHHLVRACRAQVLGFVPEPRIEEVKSRLRGNPDFDGMWDTPFPAHWESRDTVWVRDVGDGTAFEMYFRMSSDQSPFLHWALTPFDLAKYLRRYPPEIHMRHRR